MGGGQATKQVSPVTSPMAIPCLMMGWISKWVGWQATKQASPVPAKATPCLATPWMGKVGVGVAQARWRQVVLQQFSMDSSSKAGFFVCNVSMV